MSDYRGTYTENLSLSKDNEDDSYDVSRVNSNSDKIDEWAGKVNSQLNENTKKPVTFISDKIMKATSNLNVKIIGDSITCGNGGTGYICDGETIYGSFKANEKGHCWANRLKAYLENNYNCTVRNWGCGGTTSSDMVAHLSDLIKSTDDIIICAIGTNNRRVTDGLNVLYNDLNTIYTYVKNLGKDIVFMTNIPSSETGQLFTHEQINATILKFARENKIEVIPTFSEFTTYTSIFGLDSLLADGTHPTDRGYDIIFNIVTKYLNFAGYNNFGKIQLEENADLNNCWDYDCEYYTANDPVADTILNKPSEVGRSFNVRNIRCIKNTGTSVYCVQELTTRMGEKYIRSNNAGTISEWSKIITSNKTKLLSWGTYANDTTITFNDNVNNYDSLVIALGSSADSGYKMTIVRLSKMVDFYYNNGGDYWNLNDGYIQFTSTTTAIIKNLSAPIREIIGMKGMM